MDNNLICQFYKKDIEQLCKSVVNNTNNPRIELEDIIQEAYLKLLQLFNDNSVDNKSLILISIKNHLLNIIRDFKVDALYNAESLDNINSLNQ